MTYIKEILVNITKFVKLPANQQIVYLMASTIVVATLISYLLYRKNENFYKATKLELDTVKYNYSLTKKENDSLKNIIYSIKLDYLNKELTRSDSLLKESHDLKNAIKPLVKKINKKLNEVN